MTIITIIYILLIIYGLKLRKNKEEYLSKESTCNIKGIFTIMILLSHFRDYAPYSPDSIYIKIISFFGQLMVAMYLFYSGYGIMESLKSKKDYMKTFLTKRFLKTLIHFDIAVIIYAVVSILLGNKYPLSTYLLSLIGWSSVGNSNWFVFVILSLYLLTYISNLIISNKKLLGLILTTALTSLLIIILYKFKEDWWYNIILCYPCGLWYSFFKGKIEKYFLTKYKYISLIILLVLFILINNHIINFAVYEILACIFCLLIVNLTYIFNIGNKILYFIGEYSFEIYILQRLSYMLFSKLKIFSNTLVFFIAALITTIIISILFKKLINYIDKLLFNKTKKA